MNIILLYYILLLGCFNTAEQQSVKKLDLYEGDICQSGNGLNSDHICQRAENCKTLAEAIKNRLYPDICSFNGSEPIICCPLINEKTLIANKKDGILSKVCSWIIAGAYVFGGKSAKPMEYPHMALLGFGEQIEQVQWGCGGSLISKRWILTAAHCKELTYSGLARWARLGDLNIDSTTDDAQPKDYQIIQHVLHPDYHPPTLYNDIALFRLEQDVTISKYAFPICLNSDLTSVSQLPTVLTASGWGRNSTGGPTSPELLEVDLDVFSVERCNNSYFSKSDPKLKFGILNDRMICAGSYDGTRDTCVGDSGGPLQTKNPNNPTRYLLFGVTSFGRFCGDKDTPAVYTRVSYYYPWIESVVFD